MYEVEKVRGEWEWAFSNLAKAVDVRLQVPQHAAPLFRSPLKLSLPFLFLHFIHLINSFNNFTSMSTI